MVAKIRVGNSLYGALAYNGEKINEAKGRLLTTNRIFNDGTGTVDINKAMEGFLTFLPPQMKVEKPVVHISLNPHPEDVLTDTELQDIAREYLHIVSLRGGENGRKIRNPHDYDRSMSVLQELKRKYNLHPSVKGQELTDTPGLRKVNYKAGNVKQQISSVVQSCLRNYKCSSHGELRTLLEQFNVSAEEHTGTVDGRSCAGIVANGSLQGREFTTNVFDTLHPAPKKVHNIKQQRIRQRKRRQKRRTL